MGGRKQGDDEAAILNSLECLDLSVKNDSELKWEVKASMLQQRVSCFSGIYNNKIIVFGGYVNKYRRSRKFELYDESLDCWTLMNIRLQRGIDNGLLIASYEPNEFYILGGQIRGGDTKAVHKINIKEKTV